ncbi:MAG: hypothetical protein K0R65_2001 [Crocinitomicaceae bacterium]|jgi:antitoxin component YwqK of YwqJK toxin-antitoxin module|nr:hypothetical protein [Crocinitomicaceae bacterium]
MIHLKASRFALTTFLLLIIQVFYAQDTFKYKGETFNIYPHKRKTNPGWILLEGMNRNNKSNIEYMYKAQMGDYGFTDQDLAEGMKYYENEIFGTFRVTLKSKQIQEIRKNSIKFFNTPVNLHQNITPSIDVLPDGKYVQFYDALFTLNEKGDIVPYEGQVAGVFSIKNNLLDGFAYWISTTGDTIEQGNYSEGKREGKWVFRQKNDFDMNEITDSLSYDQIYCEYKDGMLDGPYTEYFNGKVRFKGFYTASEASGEWFFYNEELYMDQVSKLYNYKYYLQKHLTYAGKNPPVSHKPVLRSVVNQGLVKTDSISLPENLYQSQVDFSHMYKLYKAEIEDLELPEEKMTSYDGLDVERDYAFDEGDYGDYIRYSNEKIWYNGKELTRAKLIDSIGIQNLYKDVYEEFYPNGQLKFRYRYENGDLLYEDTVFWDNGQASNVVLYNPAIKEYTITTFDYAGKLLSVTKYDSLGEFRNAPVAYARYPKVKIEGLTANFHNDFNFYEMNVFDTLTKAHITAPTYLFKSWYYDKRLCAETLFDPTERMLKVQIRSLDQTPLQVSSYTFGEDYSYFSHRNETYLENLRAVTISNGSYSGSYHKDSLPQSKIAFIREFELTDDYTLQYEGVPFTGEVELKLNCSKPQISIKKDAIKLGVPKRNYMMKVIADYLKFQKTGKGKYQKYYPYLDLGMDFEGLFNGIFPFVSSVAEGVGYNPYDYDENEIYQQEVLGSAVTRIEGRMVNGKPVGKWIAYDQNGKIRKETHFENGEREGEDRTYAFAQPKPKYKKPRKGDEMYYYEEMYLPQNKYKKYPKKTTYYLQHVVNYHKGLMNGPEKYFDWEGNINFSVNYKDGYMEGQSLERNTLITTRSSYTDGLLDGIMRTDLTIPGRDTITLFDLNFQNHQLQGESKAYHPNGLLAKRGFFLNSQPIDDYEAFDTLGTKYHYVKFQYSFPVEEKIWEENELSVRYLYDWRDSIYFMPDDLVAIPSTYDLLMQYGLMDQNELEQPYYGRPSLIEKTGIKYHVTKYFPDQVISRDGPIDSGKKVGCWYYNNYAGVKQYEVDYFDTILKINDSIKFKSKGIRTDYDSLGNALFTSYVIEKIENYDCSHTDHYEVRQFMTIWQKDTSFHRFDGYVKNYYDDGTLQSEGQMKSGLPTGVWKYYTPNGQLNQVGEYVMGKRNGRWLKGDLSKTNYLGDICLNPNLPDLEKRLEYQENLLDINIRYFKLGKVINSEYYDINNNK